MSVEARSMSTVSCYCAKLNTFIRKPHTPKYGNVVFDRMRASRAYSRVRWGLTVFCIGLHARLTVSAPQQHDSIRPEMPRDACWCISCTYIVLTMIRSLYIYVYIKLLKQYASIRFSLNQGVVLWERARTMVSLQCFVVRRPSLWMTFG